MSIASSLESYTFRMFLDCGRVDAFRECIGKIIIGSYFVEYDDLLANFIL